MTKRPFEFEAEIPSLNKRTERLRVDKFEAKKRVMIEGQNCQSKAWQIRTYAVNYNDEVRKVHDVTAKFDGEGEVTIAIFDDLFPKVVSREGVACSETLICG